MRSAGFSKTAIDAWRKVTSDESLIEWHQKYTPFLMYNNGQAAEEFVKMYKKDLSDRMDLLRQISSRKKGVKLEDAWEILIEWKNKLHEVDHTKDFRERHKQFFYPKLSDDLHEPFYIDVVTSREKYMKEVERQRLEKKDEWCKYITEQIKSIDPLEVEKVLLKILR